MRFVTWCILVGFVRALAVAQVNAALEFVDRGISQLIHRREGTLRQFLHFGATVCPDLVRLTSIRPNSSRTSCS